MRAELKLLILLVLAIGTQCGMQYGRDDARQAWFDARAWYYGARGDNAAIDRLAAEGQKELLRRLRDRGFAPPENPAPCAACDFPADGWTHTTSDTASSIVW